jgi:hypothetical protein
MSTAKTYITMQAAIQDHLESGGNINEVIEALKQTLTLQARNGAFIEAREVNKILSSTQMQVRAKIDELY